MSPDVIAAAPLKPARLLSLDAFRGLVIALMFLVNLSGSPEAFPWWFEHAGWNDGNHGQFLADFVFPWFLFIVGVAIPFSMSGGRGAARPVGSRILAAVRRALILYFLGVVLFMARTSMDSLEWVGTAADAGGINGFVPKLGRAITWGTLLHWDILPLIALAYLLATLLWFTPRWVQVGTVLAVLVGKVVFMPSLAEQAGLGREAWMAGRTDWEYRTKALGWLGTGIAQGLPATCCAVFGMWTGQVLQSLRTSPALATRRCGVLAGCGLALVAAAFAIDAVLGHRFSKDFFTTSYVLLSAGSAMAVLAAMFWLIDGPARGRGAAGLAVTGVAWWLAVLGSNALFIYFVGEMLWAMVWMRWRVMGPNGSGQVVFSAMTEYWSVWTSPVVGPWLTTATVIGVYWGISWVMKRRGIVVKV